MAIIMNTDQYKLSNDGAPPARKENAEIFRPPNCSSLNRQKVYGVLASHPTESLSLAVVAQLTGLTAKEVYAACRFLALKGLITRKDEMKTTELIPSKPVHKKVISVQYNEPWASGNGERKW